MYRKTSSQPILSVDTKRNCLRIHKCTLHLLGDPEYIQLLVNPDTKLIAVISSTRADNLAHKVKYNRNINHNCFELYSTPLLQTLQRVTKDWAANSGYRISGEFNKKNNVAHFSMDNVIRINETEKE